VTDVLLLSVWFQLVACDGCSSQDPTRPAASGTEDTSSATPDRDTDPPPTDEETDSGEPPPEGFLERVSVASDGQQANVAGYESGYSRSQGSFQPAISETGRYVAFRSFASNLVAGDANDFLDVFLHDREKGVTTRVSVTSDGAEVAGTSQDASEGVLAVARSGRVALSTKQALATRDGDTLDDVYVVEPDGSALLQASWPSASESATWPSMTTEGDVVVFASGAHDLVAGDQHSGVDVYRYEPATGALTCLTGCEQPTQDSTYAMRPAISPDGGWVCFTTDATLAQEDTDEQLDVYLLEVATGALQRVSAPSGGEADDHAYRCALSNDGEHVAFSSHANNLVDDDTNDSADVFVWSKDGLRLASRTTAGEVPEGSSWGPSISADGRYLAFTSSANDLVPEDTNGTHDVFLLDLDEGALARASVGPGGQEGNRASGAAVLSADGTTLAFDSEASNLVEGDSNGVRDVFVASREALFGQLSADDQADQPSQ